jgi:hypothetical protein
MIIATTGVLDNEILYWYINHETTSSSDFVTNSGSFTITTGSEYFTVDTVADQITEGPETFTVSVSTTNLGTAVATSTSVTINDTSNAINRNFFTSFL